MEPIDLFTHLIAIETFFFWYYIFIFAYASRTSLLCQRQKYYNSLILHTNENLHICDSLVDCVLLNNPYHIIPIFSIHS